MCKILVFLYMEYVYIMYICMYTSQFIDILEGLGILGITSSVGKVGETND